MGDLNAKFRPLNIQTNKNGEILEKIMLEGNSEIINDKMDPTNYHWVQGRPCHAILDYFIGSSLFYNNCEKYSTLSTDLNVRKGILPCADQCSF